MYELSDWGEAETSFGVHADCLWTIQTVCCPSHPLCLWSNTHSCDNWFIVLIPQRLPLPLASKTHQMCWTGRNALMLSQLYAMRNGFRFGPFFYLLCSLMVYVVMLYPCAHYCRFALVNDQSLDAMVNCRTRGTVPT